MLLVINTMQRDLNSTNHLEVRSQEAKLAHMLMFADFCTGSLRDTFESYVLSVAGEKSTCRSFSNLSTHIRQLLRLDLALPDIVGWLS